MAELKMVRKLLFLSTKSAELRLLRNALILVGAFLLASAFSFVWWSMAIAIVISLGIYFRLTEHETFRVSYWLLSLLLNVVFSITLHSSVAHLFGGVLPYITYAVGTALFFLLFGIAHGVFRTPTSIYALLNTVLVFTTLLVSYFLVWRDETIFSITMIFIVVVIISILMREAFLWYGLPNWHTKLLSYALGTIIGELYLILSFLPLGPFNSAAFLTLVAFFGRDVFIASNRGTLSVPFVLRSLTFFVLITIVILSASPWSI